MAGDVLVAVVVTYNRLEKLKITVARLLASTPDVLRAVVVFDNGSEDGTLDWLSGLNDPRVSVAPSAQNLGGAGGFANAMKAAVDRYDPDWLVLMDDDARPMDSALERFTAQPRQHVAAWAARVVYPDGAMCGMNRPWVNPFATWSGFVRTLIRGRDGFHVTDAQTEPRDIDGTSFVGLFVSRQVMARIGYPDPALFLYGDDVLYTLAMTRAGFTLRYDPAICFEHDCDSLADGAVLQPLWKAYFYHRNLVFVIRAAAGPILFWPAVAFRVVQWRAQAGRYGADAAAFKTLFWRAIKDGLLGRKTATRTDIENVLKDRRQ